MHGPFLAIADPYAAPHCPRGCSARFVTQADGSQIVVQPPPPPKPPKPVRLPPAPDERLPAEAVRAALRQHLAQAPHGGKRPLALALGFRGRWALHSLRSIACGRGYLFEAVRRRLSRAIQQLERGELVLVPTGEHGAGKRLFSIARGASG